MRQPPCLHSTRQTTERSTNTADPTLASMLLNAMQTAPTCSLSTEQKHLCILSQDASLASIFVNMDMLAAYTRVSFCCNVKCLSCLHADHKRCFSWLCTASIYGMSLGSTSQLSAQAACHQLTCSVEQQPDLCQVAVLSALLARTLCNFDVGLGGVS